MLSRSLPVSLVSLPDGLWRAAELGSSAGATVATGHAVLDAELPGGGWPLGALSEILQAQSGQHEWRLVLPALKSRAGGPVVLVGAPQVPFGPGLLSQGFDARQLLWLKTPTPGASLWAAEQALRCAEVAAVLAWLPQVRAEQLRRLQMAAHDHSQLLFVMRPVQAQAESSPAVLRLLVSRMSGAVAASADILQLHILKRRGPPLERPLLLTARPERLVAVLARPRGRPEEEPPTGLGPRVQSLRFEPRAGHALDCTAAAA